MDIKRSLETCVNNFEILFTESKMFYLLKGCAKRKTIICN